MADHSARSLPGPALIRLGDGAEALKTPSHCPIGFLRTTGNAATRAITAPTASSRSLSK
jgi:hypothetical protein